MGLINKLKEQVAPLQKRIVLPEVDDRRVVEAAGQILAEGFAVPILVCSEAEKQQVAVACNVNLDGAEVANPATCQAMDKMVEELVMLRSKKGMTPEKAREILTTNKLYYGAMLVRLGYADGMVAGCRNSTANVLRSAIQVVGTKKGMKTVSSYMMMFTNARQYGERGTVIFSDCGVIPNPKPEQLADIACTAVQNARNVAGFRDPRVALLSFSTKGSAKSPEVDKVVEAVNILKSRNVDFSFDGELQLDAAIVPSVGAQKAPGSKVAGRANVMVFPDLQSANIGYKLVQRFAGAKAIGPLIQGLAKPIHDLSRGCSTQDIVDVVAVAARESMQG